MNQNFAETNDAVNASESVAREITYRGETLKVSPMKIGQVPAFARAIRPMFSSLVSILPTASSNGAEGEIDVSGLFNLLAEHGDHVIDAVAVATQIERAKLQDADMDEFVALTRTVVEVNADFFSRAIAKLAEVRR